jgi:mRNA interferase MazF
VVLQGEIYWLDAGEPAGSEPGFRRPFVVVQTNAANASRLRTVLLVPLTTNLSRALAPSNVRIPRGEGGLPAESIAVVSQVVTVDRGVLGEPLGRLSRTLTNAIIRGILTVIEPREPA